MLIPITEDRLSRLQAWAEQAGLSPEKLLQHYVDKLLDRPDETFMQAAAYVLQ